MNLVFGNGFIGNRLAEAYDFHLIKEHLNERQLIKDILNKHQPAVIINTIGKIGRPNIDWCESHRYETFESNVMVPLALAQECAERNVYMVHIGSGCMYQGDNGGHGFTEEDPAFPLVQVYARTKIISENALKDFDNVLQIRIRMPIDVKRNDRNLIDKLIKYPKVLDANNSITCIPDMIEALTELIRLRKTGIYNVVNKGCISPYEIVTLYRALIDPNHKFEWVSIEELKSFTLTERTNCMLNTEKLDSVFVMPNVLDAVNRCLEALK